MVVSLFTDRRMIDHQVPARHPERPERLQAILRQLERTGLWESCPMVRSVKPTREELIRVHTADIPERGLPGTRSAGRRHARCRHLVHAGVGPRGAAGGRRGHRGRLVRAGRHTIAARSAWSGRLAIMPGPRLQWAFASTPMSPWPPRAALAQFDLNQVLIVDFDVHHGNGTQEIFYDSDRVGFLSIHRYPFYPGTGREDEIGTGAGLGFTREYSPAPWNVAGGIPCGVSGRP